MAATYSFGRGFPSRFLLGITLALVCAGCQGGKGQVSGKVTYKGKPLTYGTVLVVDSGQIAQYGNIEPDGSFTVKGMSVGEAFIAVNSADPQGPYMGKVPLSEQEAKEKAQREAALKAKWFPIPQSYGDPKTSGLTYQVQSGHNRHDIELR